MTRPSAPTTPARADPLPEIPQPWLTLGRLAVVVVAVAMLILWLIGLPYRYRELARICRDGAECLALYLGPLEAAAMPAWLSFEAYALYLTAIEGAIVAAGLTVAGLLLLRRSHTRMGLLAAAAMVWVSFIGEVITSLLAERPEFDALVQPVIFFGLTVFWLFVLLFPDGRVEARWMRRWLPLFLVVLVALQSIGFLVEWGLVPASNPLASEGWWFLLLLPIILTPFFLQIVRYRRADPEQRQQLRWGVIGLGGMMVGFVAWASIDPTTTPVPHGEARLLWNVLGWTLSMICATLLPVSIGYAILRHRLWDLEVVINRALVYGSLTLTLTGIYLGTVVLVQRVLLGGRDSPLIVAGSTLLIAALFTPLRRRIQAFIDRRFYRRKVDGRRALETFAATARDQVDLDALTRELLRVVGDTVQPSHMGVWLRAERERREERR